MSHMTDLLTFLTPVPRAPQPLTRPTPAALVQQIQLPQPPPSWTVAECQQQLFQDLLLRGEGFCGSCGTYHKRYFYTFDWKLATTLAWLSRGGRQARHLPSTAPRWILTERHEGKLQYWGLVKRLGRGVWEVTSRGDDVLHERISIPAGVYVHNNKVIGMTLEHRNLTEALGKNKDYAMLLLASPDLPL